MIMIILYINLQSLCQVPVPRGKKGHFRIFHSFASKGLSTPEPKHRNAEAIDLTSPISDQLAQACFPQPYAFYYAL